MLRVGDIVKWKDWILQKYPGNEDRRFLVVVNSYLAGEPCRPNHEVTITRVDGPKIGGRIPDAIGVYEAYLEKVNIVESMYYSYLNLDTTSASKKDV